MSMTRWILLLALLTLASGQTRAAEETLPPVVQALAAKGFSDAREFPAGPNLRGFAGLVEGQPVAVYVAADGSAIIGRRVGVDGANLDEQRLQELVARPMSERIWRRAEAATWVRDGRIDAPRVIYTFTDPNCPYCHHFFEAARPWVDAGKVQLRHLMVGVIRADSPNKAAAILNATDPTAAFLSNEAAFGKGGIPPLAQVPAETGKKLAANEALMRELGFQGTPGILYRDADGMVRRQYGMPQPALLKTILGPR